MRPHACHDPGCFSDSDHECHLGSCETIEAKEKLQKVLDGVTFRNWKFKVSSLYCGSQPCLEGFMISLSPTISQGRHWFVDISADERTIVRTAWKAVEAAVLEETKNLFRYRGQVVYGTDLD